MNKLFPLSTLAIACAINPLAQANNKLEEIIVTSSRVEMPLRQVGTSVSAISSEEIKQRGLNSLYDILRSQPAVAVSNSGGPGSVSALRIRGEEGFRTQVRLDGINISDTGGTQVGPNLEHLLSSGIQRVEILRGPQGLMYGADAGGIVNISTQAPRDGFAGEGDREILHKLDRLTAKNLRLIDRNRVERRFQAVGERRRERLVRKAAQQAVLIAFLPDHGPFPELSERPLKIIMARPGVTALPQPPVAQQLPRLSQDM